MTTMALGAHKWGDFHEAGALAASKINELEKLKLKNFQLEQQALNHTRTAESR